MVTKTLKGSADFASAHFLLSGVIYDEGINVDLIETALGCMWYGVVSISRELIRSSIIKVVNCSSLEEAVQIINGLVESREATLH